MDRFDAMSVLLAAVEQGSLSKASRALGLPLATLSRQLESGYWPKQHACLRASREPKLSLKCSRASVSALQKACWKRWLLCYLLSKGSIAYVRSRR